MSKIKEKNFQKERSTSVTVSRKTRNPEKTRAKILEAAMGLFEKRGFDGCSTSDVVDACGYNKRMIYHYFGDKKGLYRAVFVKVWGELKGWFDDALQSRITQLGNIPVTTESLLTEALGIFYDFMASHPRYIRLLMWEALEGGEISKSIWKEVRGPLFIQVAFLIKEAQNENKIDSKIDPAHLVISLMGAVGFYFAYANTFVDMLGKDPFGESAKAERKDQVLLLLESIFKK